MKRMGFVATALFVATVGTQAAPPPARVSTTLVSEALHHDNFARRVVYTWTTADQVDALRKTDKLLVREVSPTRGYAAIDYALSDLADRGDEIGKLLYTTTYAKTRFAWHAPWATLLGWPGEQYGEELLRVTLKPDAIVLSLRRSTRKFTAHDLDNRDVPLADVLAHPERIAAIYFVNDESGATFREFVLCNESMIESWEYGTDEIAAEIADESRELIALAGATGATQLWPDPSGWDQAVPGPAGEYTGALALWSSREYLLNGTQLTDLARKLRHTPKRFTATGGGKATFPGAGKPRAAIKLPAKKPKNRGTYVGSYP